MIVTVPKPHLRIAGDDSIVEAAFTSPKATGLHTPQCIQIADYMISYDITTADAERIGSHM